MFAERASWDLGASGALITIAAIHIKCTVDRVSRGWRLHDEHRVVQQFQFKYITFDPVERLHDSRTVMSGCVKTAQLTSFQ